MISRDQLDIRQHAAQRMLERSISVADVLAILDSGSTIEHYPDDTAVSEPIDARVGGAPAGARRVGHSHRHGPDCDHHCL